MSKRKLFVDFDSTVVDSIKAYCDTYSDLSFLDERFKMPDHTKVQRWDLKDECSLCDDPQKIFSNELFFKNLKKFDDVDEVLQELKTEFDITIVSIGTYQNISHKARYVEKHFPYINNAILLCMHDVVMDKSIIDMSGGIFIDDHVKNLVSSNAKDKICYVNDADTKPWNKDWNGYYCFSWEHARNTIKDILEIKNKLCLLSNR